MSGLTFDQLPAAVAELHQKLLHIERLLTEREDSKEHRDQPLNVQQAADLLDLAKPTIYSMVSRGFIPYSKRGSRLYFSRNDLLQWIRDGKKSVTPDIREQVDEQLASVKRKGRRQ